MTALLALLSSLGWGTSDYLGGLRSRALGVVRTMLVSQAVSGVVLAVIAALSTAPDWSHLAVPGMLAGLSECVGVAALYRGLASGPAALVAPAAAAGPIVPLVVGLTTGTSVGAGQWAGVLLVVAGLVAAAREPGTAPRSSRTDDLRGLGFGLAAALGFGGYFVFMADASAVSVPWALLTARLTSLAIVVVVAAAHTRPLTVARSTVAGLVLIGLLIAGADASYAVSTTLGSLVLVAVLGATHPVVTIAWARWHSREVVGRQRLAAIATTLVGVVVLTAS